MKIDAFQAQGKREYMEDTMLVTDISRGTLLGIFDGHGGAGTSTWLRDNTEKVFVSKLEAVGDPQESLRYTVDALARSTEFNEDGSTLSLAFIPNYTGKLQVHTAQVGDSPIIVRHKNGWDFGSDHNVGSNKEEADNARTRGALVKDGYMFYDYYGEGLQLSRALGDAKFARIISREPDLRYFEIGSDGFMLMGSDGLFTGHTAVELMDISDILWSPEVTAKFLVEHALAVPTNDNVTAIVVRF